MICLPGCRGGVGGGEAGVGGAEEGVEAPLAARQHGTRGAGVAAAARALEGGLPFCCEISATIEAKQGLLMMPFNLRLSIFTI